MLRTARQLGCRGRRFQSSKPLILFIPNEDVYHFEGERLTPEQNKAAIPKRPRFDDVPKIHHDMLSPEYVADLVVNPRAKDVIVTSLATNSPFSGESSYKVVPKDAKQSPATVNLLFSDISRKYAEVFQEQIIQLQALPQKSPLPTLSNSVANMIHDEIQNYQQAKKVENIFTIETLTDFCEASKAFENTRKLSSGETDVSSVNSSMTLENFCIYNVMNLSVSQGQEFRNLMTFINENISLLTVQGLRRLVETLIDKLSTESRSEIIDVSCTLILDEMFNNYSSMLYHLDPTHLDRLAGILAIHGNIKHSLDILTALIETRKLAPSSTSTVEFLRAYVGANENVDPAQFIRDTTVLKSVFFSRKVTIQEAEIILDHGIRNTFEVENFVRLLSQDSNNLLLALGNQIISKMAKLQEYGEDSNILKTTRLVQLFNALKSKGFVQDSNTKTILSKAFTSTKDRINRELIKNL